MDNNYEFNFNHTPQQPEDSTAAQSENQTLPQHEGQPVSQPTAQPENQPVFQSAAQPESQPVSQSAGAPTPQTPPTPQEPPVMQQSWQPQEPQPAAPYQYPYTFHQNAAPAPQPRPAAARREKKQHWGWRIAVIAIVCAISGGLIGGAVVGGIYRAGDTVTAQQGGQSNQSGSAVQQPGSSNPPIVHTNADSSLLTPAQVYAQNVDAVVGIANESTSYNIFGQSSEIASSGSGFLISADGEVLTNYHVVEGASRLTVTLHDGSEYPATVLGYEADSDVALLKINATDLPYVSLGNSDELLVGDEVAAIGNPLGELTYSMTVGHVSSLERAVNTDGTPINMMQIDAAINSGNSGGPLFDMYGHVVGITTAKYSGSTNSGTTIEGIGFAIPINDVMEILDELRETGTVTNRAYIGITVSTATGDVKGAAVSEVVSGSSGEKAGLRSGGIITAVDDEQILVYTDLTRVLRSYRGGDKAELTAYRDGQSLRLSIVFDSKDTSGATTTPETTEPTESTQEEDSFPWGFFPGFGG